ncbi:MAG: hypothetical protein SFX73_28395 [Kofleriaceae bacterium]|nr:hypothetical protein [Kofleriaceae bacterium]
MKRAVILIAGLASMHASTAAAETRAQVDWAKGIVTAPGVGVADRHAPNPAVARGTSRRKAEDAGRKALGEAVARLPLATGGTVGDNLTDPAVAKRIAHAVEGAYAIAAEPETDGAWTVIMALPLEAVRQALTGPRALAANASDTGPTVVVVEGVTTDPAIGTMVGGIAGATLWVKQVPAWAKEAPRIKAKGAARGAIDADVGTATPSTLFVLIAK